MVRGYKSALPNLINILFLRVSLRQAAMLAWIFAERRDTDFIGFVLIYDSADVGIADTCTMTTSCVCTTGTPLTVIQRKGMTG